MKLLIVNGDDFGASREHNAGIVRSHREGILTSASLMVAEAGCEEAARMAREYPRMDVGLHLVFCQGRSVLPAERLSGMVDSDAAFRDNPVKAGLRYFFDRKLRQKLTDECRAQIERHLELIGYLNHIDGHLNIHVHPTIIEVLTEVAAEYGVPYLRLPRERVLTTIRLARDHGARKLTEAAIFRALSLRARHLMLKRGIKSADWLFGLHQSGHFNRAYLHGLLARLPENCVTELYFHPALGAGSAQHEVELLTDARTRDLVARHRIRLTNYGELARGLGELAAHEGHADAPGAHGDAQ